MASTYAFPQFNQAAVTDASPAALLAAARQEAEQLRESARQAGEQAGYAAGLAKGLEDCVPLVEAIQAASGELERTRAEMFDSLAAETSRLAVTIAEQIVSATLELEPGRVLDVTRGALRRLNDRTRVTVTVNPDDLQLLRDEAQRLKLELGGFEHLDVQADRRVGRGGAVVTTATGEIDCSIDAQLERVREIVAATISQPTAPVDEDGDERA